MTMRKDDEEVRAIVRRAPETPNSVSQLVRGLRLLFEMGKELLQEESTDGRSENRPRRRT